MTIATLEFVHDLLDREVSRLDVQFREVRKARQAVDPDDPRYQELTSAYRDASSALTDASAALHDFESKEW